jgi:hypothetical protein
VRTLVLIVVCFAMLVGASAAFADSSTILNGYGSTGSNAVVEVKGAQASPPKAVAASTGTLPFTGSELGLVVGGGIVLLGMGLALRRIGRDNL